MSRSGRKQESENAGAGPRGLRLLVLIAALVCVAAFIQPGARGAQEPGQKDAAANPAGGGTRGQTGASSGNFRVRVEVVDVPVTVLDKRGMPVIDLTKSDFKIFEDGKRQTIRYFNRETPPPLRIGLILDTSNSARPALKFEKEAASEFIYNILQGLNSENEIFLQTFDATSSIVQDFTNDPDRLNEKLQKLKAGGGKSLYDAIYFACRQKLIGAGPPERTRHVLVLISDGLDVQSKHTLAEAISMAHRAETSIYTIGNATYGFSNPGDKYLDEIAEQTGGESFFPLRHAVGVDLLTGYLSHGQIDSMETNKGLGAESGIYTANRMIKLADSLDSIQRQLNNQYILGYTPTNGALDGSYRTIKVTVHKKDMSLHYKPGYFATVEK
jgi:Mg-chelatase subunit ChlD